MQQLVEISQAKVRDLYQLPGLENLLYHNIQHTREVVEGVKAMSAHYQLPPADAEALCIAAWWHDVGYIYSGPQQHEQVGAIKAREFLTEHGADADLINKVEACILATRLPQKPIGLIQEIICDADLMHLGGPGFFEKSKALRKEMEKLTLKRIKGSEWRESTIRLLQSHNYFTDYARNRLDHLKQTHLDQLVLKQDEKEVKRNDPEETPQSSGAEEPIKDTKSQVTAATKVQVPKRGIETMFRLTSSNHMDLSALADSKANIMISVNSIIISVVLSVLFRRLEDLPYLVAPTMMLLIVNVATIIFAVRATRPNVTRGLFTRDDILQKKVNLLFFGNFHQVRLSDYEWGMKEMIKDRDYLYSSLIKDIYFLGVVLGKKYKLLRISYNIFMYGLILSVLAFAIGGWLGSIRK